MGGIDTLDIAFKYRFQGAGTLMCPHESFCGDKLYIASSTESREMETGGQEWSDLQICNFKFVFSLFAGPSDILMVQFTEVENLTIRYFIGTSYNNV